MARRRDGWTATGRHEEAVRGSRRGAAGSGAGGTGSGRAA